MNTAEECMSHMNDQLRNMREMHEEMLKWKARQDEEKHRREVGEASDIRQMAEDSRIARFGAMSANRKSNLAICIAAFSALLSFIAIMIAHYDSEQTTKAIVTAIENQKGASK